MSHQYVALYIHLCPGKRILRFKSFLPGIPHLGNFFWVEYSIVSLDRLYERIGGKVTLARMAKLSALAGIAKPFILLKDN